MERVTTPRDAREGATALDTARAAHDTSSHGGVAQKAHGLMESLFGASASPPPRPASPPRSPRSLSERVWGVLSGSPPRGGGGESPPSPGAPRGRIFAMRLFGFCRRCARAARALRAHGARAPASVRPRACGAAGVGAACARARASADTAPP
jgi:hypothetical protein